MCIYLYDLYKFVFFFCFFFFSSRRRHTRYIGDWSSDVCSSDLKWSQPAYAKQLQQRMGKEVDYTKRPSEDFASVMIEFATDDGATVLGEATTSWSFVGAGLRLSAELLGPEYSMSWNSLDSPDRKSTRLN